MSFASSTAGFALPLERRLRTSSSCGTGRLASAPRRGGWVSLVSLRCFAPTLGLPPFLSRSEQANRSCDRAQYAKGPTPVNSLWRIASVKVDAAKSGLRVEHKVVTFLQ